MNGNQGEADPVPQAVAVLGSEGWLSLGFPCLLSSEPWLCDLAAPHPQLICLFKCACAPEYMYMDHVHAAHEQLDMGAGN